MTERDILERTRGFVKESFLYMRPGFVLSDDDKLMEKGVIDSMGVLELMEFLQATFGVTFSDDEITEENLGTLSAIARFVSTKRSANRAKVNAS
jgi:acyl carrier protein